MGYFYDKYQDMKAKREEKKELQAAAEQYVEDFKNTVHYLHYKQKLEESGKDFGNSASALLKTAEKISEPEGDPRYKTPKKEPAVPRELAESVIEETEIYKRAKESILNAQLRQVSYGIEKYPEPLKADTWTILETIRHIKEESIDTLHYLTMLEIKFEELARQELPSTEELSAKIRELMDRVDEMKKRLEKPKEHSEPLYYHNDKPYDMNYETQFCEDPECPIHPLTFGIDDTIRECPADECCGNPKGCEKAGNKIEEYDTETPKTPNQLRKECGIEFVNGIDFTNATNTDWTTKGMITAINLKNTDIINYSPIDFTKAAEEAGIYLPGDIKVRGDVKPAGDLGIVRVSSEGLADIPIIVRHTDSGIAEEDARYVQLAVEEQIAKSQLRRNQ